MLIKVDDYHEFDYIEDVLRQVIRRVKVKELPLDPDPQYTGIIYLRKDAEYRKLLKLCDPE
jgi:hypothetical protein